MREGSRLRGFRHSATRNRRVPSPSSTRFKAQDSASAWLLRRKLTGTPMCLATGMNLFVSSPLVMQRARAREPTPPGMDKNTTSNTPLRSRNPRMGHEQCVAHMLQGLTVRICQNEKQVIERYWLEAGKGIGCHRGFVVSRSELPQPSIPCDEVSLGGTPTIPSTGDLPQSAPLHCRYQETSPERFARPRQHLEQSSPSLRRWMRSTAACSPP